MTISPPPQIGFTGTRHGMTPSQRSVVIALVRRIANGAPFVAHHGDCIGADAEFHDLCRDEPGSFLVVHPGPLDDLPNQAGRIGNERRAPAQHMRRNKNIVLASTIVLAAPFEPTPQLYGGTWRTIDMANKAKRPLAIVSRDGVATIARDEELAGSITPTPRYSRDT